MVNKYVGILSFVIITCSASHGYAATQADYDAFVTKNKAAYAALQKKVNDAPALLAAKQCAMPGSFSIGPLDVCATSADLLALQKQQQAAEVALKSQIIAPVVSQADYDALVAKNKAEYDALKKKVDNAPMLLAAKQCAMPGSFSIGPLDVCATSADLTALQAKHQAAEAALKSQMTASAGAPSGEKCAPEGSFVAGPVPVCPTTQTGATANDYDKLVAQNNAAYDALKKQVDNAPAMLAAGKCTMPGTFSIGPLDVCPTASDLTALLNKNQAAEAALKSKLTAAVTTAAIPVGTSIINGGKQIFESAVGGAVKNVTQTATSTAAATAGSAVKDVTTAVTGNIVNVSKDMPSLTQQVQTTGSVVTGTLVSSVGGTSSASGSAWSKANGSGWGMQ